VKIDSILDCLGVEQDAFQGGRGSDGLPRRNVRARDVEAGEWEKKENMETANAKLESNPAENSYVS